MGTTVNESNLSKQEWIEHFLLLYCDFCFLLIWLEIFIYVSAEGSFVSVFHLVSQTIYI